MIPANPTPQRRKLMADFRIELVGPDAQADAEALCRALAGAAHTWVAPTGASKGLDPVVVITVAAAVLQSADIIYRFYQEWRSRQRPAAGSRPQMTIIRPDGTRIELAAADAQTLKALLE
jgi:hypothetical protein